MSAMLESKILALKTKIEYVEKEIERFGSGLGASPLEKMRLNSLKQEKEELKAKLRELGI